MVNMVMNNLSPPLERLGLPFEVQPDIKTSKCENSLTNSKATQTWEPQVRWLDLIAISFVHLGALYGLYLLVTGGSFLSFLYIFLSINVTGLGITAGAHRLWSHRAYKAAWPLRLVLALAFTVTGQRDIYTWALDHRVHHKFSETDADPHDARRGFLFAHVGWLVLTPHPAVVVARKQVDMRDLEADWVVMWQKKIYIFLFALLTIGLPVAIPHFWWGESLWFSFWVNFNLRFAITLNIAFFVNSVAHMWGSRPYDQFISPVENFVVSMAALGEGYHNYHHVFPFDYKTGELGTYVFNFTTGFIDTCANLGLAWDRKFVSPEMILRRRKRTGDLQHNHSGEKELWGWGDNDMLPEDVEELEKKSS